MFFDETGQAIVTNSFPMVPGLFDHYFQWSRTIKRWNGFYHWSGLSEQLKACHFSLSASLTESDLAHYVEQIEELIQVK